MTIRDHLFSTELIQQINKIIFKIDSLACWQQQLLSCAQLANISKQNKTSDISEEYVRKLWQLGFLQADIIVSKDELAIKGFSLLQNDESSFIYSDERLLDKKLKGYVDSFQNVSRFPESIDILFHPFRCFVLYHIERVFKLRITSMQTLLYSEAYGELVSIHIDHLNKWTSDPKTGRLFGYWNNLVSLCVISETASHNQIYNKITWDVFDSYETVVKKLIEIQGDVSKLFEGIDPKAIEEYRNEICRDAETIDPNKNLHLIIRLMKSDERAKLNGHIAGAMLFLAMAESLRRNLERTVKKDYPEEDECGFGEVNRDFKQKIQGGSRVLDGNRLVANQFLRRFGLDYGIRVNIYVEGQTEYGAITDQFNNNSSILVINLKGNFVEKNGKGVAFRESLRNDIRSKIFSLILLDGDVSDNLRALKQAALNDEICGMFFVSNPDFEFENFTIAELADITYNLANENRLESIDRDKLLNTIKACKSAKEFFKALYKYSPDLLKIAKGVKWGKALLNYATRNPLTKRFGDEKDRKINQLIKVANQCSRYTYETTRQGYRVNPETGTLVKR
jgi:hypothetical protein